VFYCTDDYDSLVINEETDCEILPRFCVQFSITHLLFSIDLSVPLARRRLPVGLRLSSSPVHKKKMIDLDGSSSQSLVLV
jgi:hypothetical protein